MSQQSKRHILPSHRACSFGANPGIVGASPLSHPPLACTSLQSSKIDLPVVSLACFRRKEEFMCKVPWVLETQKHVLDKLSAWLADFSSEKRKLLN